MQLTRRMLLLSALVHRLSAQVKGKLTNDDQHQLSNMDMASDLLHGGLKVAPTVQSNIQPVYTRSYDNQRSCTTLAETTLTPANVGQLTKRFSLQMIGDARGAEAQPLLVPNVLMPCDGIVHDLAIVCAMSNLVWCFDANTGTLLWVQRLGNPIQGSNQIDAWKINDHWGILSTPVIDPETLILYAVAWSSSDGTQQKGVHALHALDIKTGAPVMPASSLENASYNPGHGLPTLTYKTMQRKQRAGLLFLKDVAGNKTIFVACGTISETSAGARGWVIAFAASTLTIAAAITTTSRYSGAGIWMAGQGLSSDKDGFIYAMTGNGGFDGITDFGESFIRLKFTPGNQTTGASLSIVDWWSPFSDSGRVGIDPTLPDIPGGTKLGPNVGYDDMDLGSGGPAIIGDAFIAGAGKDGILYVLKREAMGRTAPADFANPGPNYAKLASPPIWFTFYPGNGISSAPTKFTDLNRMYNNRTHHNHSTPVVYQSPTLGTMLFCWGENSQLRAWTINAAGVCTYQANSDMSASANAGVPPGGMPGAMICLSANGAVHGSAILWACVPYLDANKVISNGVLVAYAADVFAKRDDGSAQLRLLYQSPPFTFNKFCPPVVSGGKVYVATYDGKVDVYSV